MAVQTYKQTGA